MSIGYEMTSCPIVRDETLTLFDRVEVGGKSRYLPFEQRVLWLRDSESEITLAHRGVLVDRVATLNDFYGFLTSLEQVPRDDMRRLITRFKLDDTTDLIVTVTTKITDTPVLYMPDGGSYAEYRGREGWKQPYRHVPSYYNGSRWWFTSDQPNNEHSSHPTLGPIEVAKAEGIYTSRDGVELPARAVEWIAQQREAAKPIDVYASLRKSA